MKKIALIAALALSSSLVSVGYAEAVDSAKSYDSPSDQIKHHQANGVNGAQGRPHQGGFVNGGHHGRGGGLQQLDLSAEQEAQIAAIRNAQQQSRQANRTQRDAQRQQMRQQTQALINSASLDSAALNRLADQHAALSKQQFVERVQTQHAIAQVLTDEQRAQLQQMRDEHNQMGEGRGRLMHNR